MVCFCKKMLTRFLIQIDDKRKNNTKTLADFLDFTGNIIQMD